MRWLLVAVLFGGLTARSAHANQPPLQCHAEPARQAGYVWGSLYAGFFSTPDLCATAFTARGLSRFPLLFYAGALLQLDAHAATADDNGVGFRRARLTTAMMLWQRFVVVASGDAAERSIPDAYLLAHILTRQSEDDDNTFAMWLEAGRRVVPFGLEAQWSDAKLPFLERATALEQLSPAQRQYGVSLAAARLRHLELPTDTGDTDRRLLWHAELGMFQPLGERDSYTVGGRAFVRLERENEYNSFAEELHIGVSAAIGRRFANEPDGDFLAAGDERHYALEAEARYRRVRASAELVSLSQEAQSLMGERATLHETGGALTLTATLRPNPYRWYTVPLQRSPMREPWHVDPSEADDPNVGIELDVGIDAMRGDFAETDVSSTKLRVAAHAFVHDFVKLSCAYSYTTEHGHHAVIARLQLAL